MGWDFELPFIKLTIFQKLLIGIFAMLILTTIIAFISIVSINELENTSYVMLEESQEQSSFQKLKLNVQQLLMPANDYLIHGNKVEQNNFNQLLSVINAQINECREIIGHPMEKKALDEFEKSLAHIESLALDILKLENPIGNLEGSIKMEEMDAFTNEAINEIDELLIIASIEMTKYINTNQAIIIRATRIIIGIGLFIAICLVFGGYFYVKHITTPIKQLEKTAQKISLGGFAAKPEIKTGTYDEIESFSKSFNDMIGILEKTTVSRDYFNSILNRMVDTLIITDTDSVITIVNQATLDLLEYTEEEIVGQKIEKIFYGDNSNSIIIDDDKNPCNESVQNVYNTYYSKAGKAIPVSFSRSQMYDNDNNISGTICIAFNNTEAFQDEQSVDENSDSKFRCIKAVGEIPLTKRELEVIKLITEELSNREIADKLFISVRTVETHRKNIMQKLHTKSVITLVLYAAQNGII